MKGLEEPISEKTWSDCIMKYIAIVKFLWEQFQICIALECQINVSPLVNFKIFSNLLT